MLELISVYQRAYPEPDAAIAAKIKAIDLEFIQQDFPKLLDSMEMGTQRIQEIVLSLRNFSRLDESDRKAVDLHEGIDNTLIILGSRLKGTVGMPAVNILKDYGKLPPVECYPGQLNQVFMNILTNAIDALEEKFGAGGAANVGGTANAGGTADSEAVPQAQTPQITLRTERLSTNRLRIVIADNGIGMSDSIKQQMFNPFYTTKPVGRGTGMGMSISYQIITQKHGGYIVCNSIQGQGTEFVINLPA
ncbi:MAG: ATP-binding protein [Cyanobacteria bacterium P01_A01_bin.114]